MNLKENYLHIQSLTLTKLKKICQDYQCQINDYDLNIILQIIKNNVYALVTAHYHPALYNEIEKETNISVCHQFKPIIQDSILLF